MPRPRTRFRAAFGASLLGITTVAALRVHAGGRPCTSRDPAVAEALGRIRPDLIRAHVRLLADDLLEGRTNDARRPSWHEGDYVLSLAGRYVTRLEEELAVLVADETYAQSLFIGPEGSARQRRSLVSDVAWVPTGDAFVWAFFRDVREVDGDPVRDRAARLEQLFPSGMTLAGRERAQEILEESARYNLGRRRTVNCPTVALSFLHPRNQPRFGFRLDGGDEKHGATTWKVRFTERARPALTRTSRGDDVPARGHLWVEAGTGALVASRLELRPPGLGPVTIETDYARDDRFGAWLPAAMQEAYGNRSRSGWDERVEATARYSGWRRAQVEVQPIVPVP